MRRPLALLTVLLLAVACGDDGGSSGETGGEVRTTPVTFGAGDEVWLQIETGGGYVPQIFNLREVPSGLLFDDGRLVRLVDGDDGIVPELDVVQLDEEGAAELLEQFAAVVDGPDPGTPNVTDLPSTTIEVTTDGDTRDLSIYALGFDEDDSLTDEQQEAREAASAALDAVDDLDGGEPFVPDEWLVETIATQTDVGGAASPIAWPLAPDRQATLDEHEVCTRVTGDDRDAVLDALEGADPYALVSTGGELAEIALRPVLTGDEECSDGFVER